MRFPEGNRIMYGQDFSWWHGIPHDVDFEVCEVQADKFWLKAPGYGGVPYGNGRIVVYLKTVADKEKKPKPERCEACRQADEWDRIHNNQSDLAQHYRDYHCTCKKEAP